MSDHACFSCGHPVSHHSGQAEATGCHDCDCQHWFNVYPPPLPAGSFTITGGTKSVTWPSRRLRKQLEPGEQDRAGRDA